MNRKVLLNFDKVNVHTNIWVIHILHYPQVQNCMAFITTEIVFTVNYTVIVSFSFAHMLLVHVGESDLTVSWVLDRDLH